MRYNLSGLDCASCAAKIEKELRKKAGLEEAAVNFADQSLEIPPEQVDKAREIISSIEPGVKIKDPVGTEKTMTEEKINKNRLYAIILSFFLLAVGNILNHILRQISCNFVFLLLICSYMVVGWPVLYKAFLNIRRGRIFDENFLMSTATLGAIAIKELNEAVAVMLFYATGEYIQNLAVNNSRRSIAALVNIRPDYANLYTEGEMTRVRPEEVLPEQTIVIKPGEKVPLDGYVIEGNSFADTSILTGESVPRRVKPGDKILSGTINGQGVLTVKVSKPYKESSINKIMELVENAASRKAPAEQFITVFSRYYTPVVVALALMIALVPPLVLPEASLSTWAYRALVLLVISCPCAFVISVPLVYFGGLGSASRQGILVKGANYLDALANVQTVVFDKTGTLTKGVFKVNKVVPLNGFSEETVLDFAATAEYYSNHPIAVSIREAFGRDIRPDRINSYREIPGQGISAIIDGKQVLLGGNNIKPPGDNRFNVNNESTVIHVVVDHTYAGYITISDEIKNNSREAIEGLKKLGINLVMLTGDEYSVARNVAEQLAINSCFASLLPEDKIKKVEELRSAMPNTKKQKLAYVGDGINDAPVLARADIGVAMGALGADAAIEAADVVLMDDNPSKLVTAVKISRRTGCLVRQNIIWALGIKFFFLCLGMFGMANIWEAVFADVGVTIIAILNASRILKYKET